MDRHQLMIELGFLIWLTGTCCSAGDQPQWGERHSRNMISRETGLAVSFDPQSGRGIKWSVSLGKNAYGPPVIADKKVYIGANNAEPRDPRYQGDRAVLLCLNESDGTLCWQLAVPRIAGGDIYKDWSYIGFCSPPTVEGDRLYVLTNRCEVVCLDVQGQTNGNDGFQDEARFLTRPGESGSEVTNRDADLLWVTDLREAVGIYPHDAAYASILIDGDWLYLNTCNGVDSTHRTVQRPDAPSLVVLNKNTGRCVAQDTERIGYRIIHSNWSSPALARIGTQKQVVFAGGDGVVYGFEALDAHSRPPQTQDTLKRVWRFDCDPNTPKDNIRDYRGNRTEGPSTISGMPVVYNHRTYLTAGGDIWWGKRQSWLICFEPSMTGDNAQARKLWSSPLVRQACATPSIDQGLVFVGDCSGLVHCVDAQTGRPYWTHKLRREIWGSTLVADGKVYVGSRSGELCILTVSKEKQVLSTIQFDAPISTTPVAANGVLYVATQERLYAVKGSDAQ